MATEPAFGTREGGTSLILLIDGKYQLGFALMGGCFGTWAYGPMSPWSAVYFPPAPLPRAKAYFPFFKEGGYLPIDKWAFWRPSVVGFPWAVLPECC